MCTPQPSITLYGTEQVPTTRTITHTTLTTYLAEPLISLSTQTIPCPAVTDPMGQVCQPEITTSLVTITPVVTSTILSVEVRPTVMGRVVPQQTLYYPCPSDTTALWGDVGSAERDGRPSGLSSKQVDGLSTTRVVVLSTSVAVSATRSTPSSLSFVVPTPTGSPTSFILSPPAGLSSSLSSAASSSSSSLLLTDSPPASASISNTAAFSSSPAGAGDAESASSASPSKGPVIAGSIIGSLVALSVLLALLFYYRRKRSKIVDSASEGGTVEYWERRFRELESDEKNDERSPSGRGAHEMGTDVPATGGPGASEAFSGGSKRIRLTLDLKSSRLSSRASRLSAISAFFRPPGGRKSRSSVASVDFSKSRAETDRGGSPIMNLGRVGSRAESGRSLSTWLLFLPAMRKDSHIVRSSAAVYPDPHSGPVDISGSLESGDSAERRGMESIRPIATGSGHTEELSRAMSAENNGGYPTRLLARWSDMARSPRTPDLLSPEITVLHGAVEPSNEIEQGLSSISPVSSRQLTPPKRSIISPTSSLPLSPLPPPPLVRPPLNAGLSGIRRTKNKPPPVLHLSREATTPSLWIDEDVFERLGLPRHSPSDRVAPGPPDQSRFSPDSSVAASPDIGAKDVYGGIAETPISASTFGRSQDDSTPGRPAARERSAVTPQLPMMGLEGARLSMGWDGGGAVERMKSVYQQDQ